MPFYDEDAPELSLEQMQRYRKAAIDKKAKTAVTLELSQENMDKAHSFGKEYRNVLSRLLELAMDDQDLIRKAQIYVSSSHVPKRKVNPLSFRDWILLEGQMYSSILLYVQNKNRFQYIGYRKTAIS